MGSLKLVMAVSKDGFVSLGSDDDMLWTGPDDKRAFRLLTSVGGILGAGRRTFERLPRLRGRRVYCISTRRAMAIKYGSLGAIPVVLITAGLTASGG